MTKTRCRIHSCQNIIGGNQIWRTGRGWSKFLKLVDDSHWNTILVRWGISLVEQNNLVQFLPPFFFYCFTNFWYKIRIIFSCDRVHTYIFNKTNFQNKKNVAMILPAEEVIQHFYEPSGRHLILCILGVPASGVSVFTRVFRIKNPETVFNYLICRSTI